MTIEKERERRANQIVRNADAYGSDSDFRNMVDNTVYLTQEQQESSQHLVDATYGTRHTKFESLDYQRRYGA